MPEANNKASAFVIRELTGLQRTLRLTGRALPYRPIEFSGTMRADFTWYPGNPEATVQLLGAAEDDTTINGMWKNRFLSDTETDDGENANANQSPPATITVGSFVDTTGGRALATSVALVDEVNDIRRQGQLLEVTWDSKKRRGIMMKFVDRWSTHQDVEWSMTFGWISQGEETVPAVLNPGTDLASTSQSWQSALKKLKSIAENVQGRYEQAKDFAADINAKITKVESTVTEIQDTIAGVVDSITDTGDTVRRLEGVMNTINTAVDETLDVLGRQPPVETRKDSETEADISTLTPNAPGATNPAIEVSVGLTVAAELFNRDLERTVRDMQRQAARQRADFNKRTNPDLLAVFTARQDTDLRNVADQFYGAPDEWRKIQTDNNLNSSKLTAGQIVYIHKIQEAA